MNNFEKEIPRYKKTVELFTAKLLSQRRQKAMQVELELRKARLADLRAIRMRQLKEAKEKLEEEAREAELMKSKKKAAKVRTPLCRALSLPCLPSRGLSCLYFLPFYSIRCCLCCLYIPPDYHYLTSLSPSPYVPLPGVNLIPISSLQVPLGKRVAKAVKQTIRGAKDFISELQHSAATAMDQEELRMAANIRKNNSNADAKPEGIRKLHITHGASLSSLSPPTSFRG